MMNEWIQDGNSMQKMEEMMQEWGKSWDMQMNMQQMPVQQQPMINFQVDNPYMMQITENIDTRDNLSIAKELIEKGMI